MSELDELRQIVLDLDDLVDRTASIESIEDGMHRIHETVFMIKVKAEMILEKVEERTKYEHKGSSLT